VRPGIDVRSVQPEDLEQLVDVCLSARRETWSGTQVCSSDPETVSGQLGALAGAPGGTILVARCDDVVVGVLLGRVMGPNLFTDDVNFAVEAVYVDPRHRRKGVGHALMLVAVELAIVAGAEQVFAAPIPGARGMQRFFVRLGFVPAAAHRVTTTASLHRRLTADAQLRTGARPIDELIARRRQSRGDVTPVDQDVWRGSITRHVSRAVHTRRALESTTTIS
jgi:GNAT superfamily N-acetyltransferase